MSHRHPSEESLKAFAKGDIEEKIAALISAHIVHCSYCSKFLKNEEALHAHELLQVEPFKKPDFESVYDRIVHPKSLDLETLESLQGHSFPAQLEVEGVVYELPYSLRPLAARISDWKKAGQSLSFAKIDMPGPGRFYFVRFAKGAKISQHGHKGKEFSYVIAGSFNDETTEYVTGDFAWFDTGDTHTPQTQDPDGCLLAVMIEAPFHFKKGFARLLNPLGMWPY